MDTYRKTKRVKRLSPSNSLKNFVPNHSTTTDAAVSNLHSNKHHTFSERARVKAARTLLFLLESGFFLILIAFFTGMMFMLLLLLCGRQHDAKVVVPPVAPARLAPSDVSSAPAIQFDWLPGAELAGE